MPSTWRVSLWEMESWLSKTAHFKKARYSIWFKEISLTLNWNTTGDSLASRMRSLQAANTSTLALVTSLETSIHTMSMVTVILMSPQWVKRVSLNDHWWRGPQNTRLRGMSMVMEIASMIMGYRHTSTRILTFGIASQKCHSRPATTLFLKNTTELRQPRWINTGNYSMGANSKYGCLAETGTTLYPSETQLKTSKSWTWNHSLSTILGKLTDSMLVSTVNTQVWCFILWRELATRFPSTKDREPTRCSKPS